MQAAQAVPDVLTDAALMLYMTSRPLLDGVYGMQDKEAKLVLLLLRSLHRCFSAVDLDDYALRATASIKLGLLLEEQVDAGGLAEGGGAGSIKLGLL